jgi:hypothetical protein
MHNKPMRKKTRRVLFFVSVALFILIGCGAVIFALGYKYDFVQNKFLKTGSLEIELNVPAEIYINDELAGGTSFLGNSFSKGRLLPRSYRVRVEKNGYQTWQKLLKIEAGFLTSHPKVVLIPESFDEVIVASSSLGNISVKRFGGPVGLAIVGNKQKLESIDLETGEKKEIKPPVTKPASLTEKMEPIQIVSPDKEKTAWFSRYEIWVKWLKDTDYQPYKLAGDTEFLTRFSQKIEDIQWYKDSAHLVVSVGGILKLIEIDDRDGINIFDITAVSDPFYYDRDLDTVFKFEENQLVRINLSR